VGEGCGRVRRVCGEGGGRVRRVCGEAGVKEIRFVEKDEEGEGGCGARKVTSQEGNDGEERGRQRSGG
jgi:hypothetical protein